MWAEYTDDAMAFPDFGAGGDPSDLFAYEVDQHVKGGGEAGGPAPASMALSPSLDVDRLLDDFLQTVAMGAPRRHSGQGPDECLVCYDVKSDTDHAHTFFSRCGHGQQLCVKCADKVHRCPLCRDIKEGWESYVMATEALQGSRPCEEQFGDSRATSFFLPHDEVDSTPSCSAAPGPESESDSSSLLFAPSHPEVHGDVAMDTDLDELLGPDAAAALRGEPLAGPAPPLWDAGSDSATQPPQALDGISLTTAVPSRTSALSQTSAAATPTAPTRSGRAKRRTAGINRNRPATTSTSTVQRRPQANAIPAPAAKRTQRTNKTIAAPARLTSPPPAQPPRKRSTTVTREKDNPFARFNVPDDDVESLSFKEFSDLMTKLKFRASDIAAAKRFRKRLKNRRQVMLYADKQRNNTESLRTKNKKLVAEVENLTQVNTQLQERNHELEQTLEYLEQARTDAVNECTHLQEQMLNLTVQMNELGLFAD